MEEILNINKPQGITSFQVVKKIRSKMKIKKVGHAGTLDPFATGVLLVLLGRATKKADEFLSLDKEYVAKIELGKESDTGDVDGNIAPVSGVSSVPDLPTIERTVQAFIGEIEQTPPIYSAIKYKGQPLYKYARKGIPVTPRPRKVRIHAIQILNYQWPYLELKITCSKGTYIRSLATDIGRKLGTGAYVYSLTRTRVGEYRVEDALSLEKVLASWKMEVV